MDIAFAGVVFERAPQSERTDRPGNQVSEHDSEQSTQSRDHQRFSKELEQNVPAMRAKSFLDADLARALRDRHQHDIHQSDATDAKREQADEAKQNLDSRRDHLQVHQVGEDVEDKDGATILGTEFVVKSHRLANRVHDLGMIALVLHDDGVQVIRVHQIAHRAVGNIDVFVDVVVAVLDLMFEDPHDLVRNAVDADTLPNRFLSREELLLRVGTNDRHARVSEVIGFAEEAAVLNLHFAHASVSGINTAYAIIRAARSVRDNTVLERLRRDSLQQRNFSTNVVDVIHSQPNLRTCLRSARLEFGAPWKDEYKIGAEGAECRPQAALEASAVGQQQHNRCDAPRHSQHGQHASPAVVAERVVGLGYEIEDHQKAAPGFWLLATGSLPASLGRSPSAASTCSYSCLNASTGGSRAAFLAGYRPAAIPATASDPIAARADAGIIRGVSKPSGEGSMASNVTNAVAMARPMPPLKAVRNAPSIKNCVRIAR